MRDKQYHPKLYVNLTNPEWIRNATLYELNVRQFSNSGHFREIEDALPRLKKMGIDIIWLMPVHPIGKINRKGSLGSVYSVRDFMAVNPEMGNEEDFRHLVEAIHHNGMHVILDWVANHSSWDNALAREHPDWYKRSAEGDFMSLPWRDYDDIIVFDYQNADLRKYMTSAMKFWVQQFNIDGFRCDLASFIPLDFWENVRFELEKIKPVFMLAEGQDRDLHRNAFDVTYSWDLWTILRDICTGGSSLNTLTAGYIAEHVSVFPKAGIRLNFIDNHDKNSWEGNPFSNFGKGLKAAMVLLVMMDGMPLVYNGQEAGLQHSLKFFERDPIPWRYHENAELYAALFALKHRNQALWNGKWGGEMIRIENDHPGQLLSFFREKGKDRVITVINLGNQAVCAELYTSFCAGAYTDLFKGERLTLPEKVAVKLDPWAYLVMHNT